MSQTRPPVLDDWSGDPWDDPDHLYTFEGERPRRSRRGARIIGFSLLIVVVVLLLVAGAAGLWLTRQLNPPGEAKAPVNFTVEAGDTIDAISKRLKAQGIITNDAVFRWYADHKQQFDIQPGYYTLKPHDTMGNILAVLRTPPAQTFDNVVFPEGFTVAQIGKRLQDTIPRLQQAVVIQAATDGQIRSKYAPAGINSLEGLLFPAKYQIGGNDNEQKVVQRLAHQMELVGAQVGLDDMPPEQAYQTLVMASMVEREAKVADDRPKIARVILNRLYFDMPLQIDSTLFYNQPPDTPFATLQATDTPYNTYMHKGLPPTPIANPGKASIQAVLNPAPNPDSCPTNGPGEPCAYLFYVLAGTDGHHAFATNVRDHEANVNAAKAAGLIG
jgi:peptidoglycan lytic transglycosylase G